MFLQQLRQGVQRLTVGRDLLVGTQLIGPDETGQDLVRSGVTGGGRSPLGRRGCLGRLRRLRRLGRLGHG
ncbi:hypothetical protein ACFFX0_06690 [Citricoccus parietis]|uniref:Uncharacterized protein n=1 Tax=Citricoccus parietis TaxID=592307 RepID=A0ABV5FW66_9MICC